MAVVRYGAGLGEYGSPTDVVDMLALTLVGPTRTSFSLRDPDNNSITLEGSRITYGAGSVSGGTVTAITFRTPTGEVLFSITGLSVDAPSVIGMLADDGASSLGLLAGRDRLFGSVNGDLMMGGNGNDTVNGFGGADIIGTSGGLDELRGGAGKDFFVFQANKGVDTVLDFGDTGAAGDDLIVVRKALYDQMTMTEQGDDLLLTFGSAGTLLILDQTLADMGRDDFTFTLIGATG